MKRKLLIFILCFAAIVCLLVSQGCGTDVFSDLYEEWDASKGTVSISELADGTKKIEKFDLKNRLVRAEYYDTKDALTHLVTYEYNQNNRLIHELKMSADKTLLSRGKYVYDDQGVCTGKKISDSNGVLTEEEFFLPDGTTDYHCRYTYNENGLLIRTDKYKGSSTVLMGYTTQEYYETGQIKSFCEYDAAGVFLHGIRYDYNEDGLTTSMLQEDNK